MDSIRWRGVVALAAVLSAGVIVAPPAGAVTTTYSAEETIPVPPASGFQGSGGGDGWAVALSPTGVYNVHHHNFTITVACRKQVDASQCWTAPTKEATDPAGGTFNTLHPGLHLDQSSGFLYVYATRNADGVGGVVCLDTAVADADPNPFCGFSALTAPAQSSYGYMTNGVSVGNRFYAVNHDNGGGIGAKVLCFDVAAMAACPGQPYAADVGSGSAGGSANTISAIGSRLYVPNSGNIGCFETTTATECAGSWPIPASTGYGAPFPLLDASGTVIGVCNPDGTVPCFDLSGSLVPTPAGLANAVGYTQYWNGPALTIGSRVYVPSGTNDTVICYDYAVAATCPNFPHPVPGANYMYTVNADPHRPSCIWVNADNGAAQIQNFDAFGGIGCGEGPIRVLASSIVVDSPECTPSTYTSLAVVDPARDQYGSGFVAFEDGSGLPIPGVDDVSLDGAGVADLQGLELNTARGLPQFLITLTDPVGSPGSVTVRLTWTGEDDPGCDPNTDGLQYVAIGDSYSSGEGTYEYNDGRCHRGPLAWPRRLDELEERLEIARHVACTGARTNQLFEEYKGTTQVDVAHPDPSVDLVTVTIGGNDVGFRDILIDCRISPIQQCLTGNKYTQFQDTVERVALALEESVYRKLRTAFPNARIVHVGYPELFPGTGEDAVNCGWLTSGEKIQVEKAAQYLDLWLGIAAGRSQFDIEYISSLDALDGHELCTPDSWVQPISPQGEWRAVRSEQAHPTADGQIAWTADIANALADLGIL